MIGGRYAPCDAGNFNGVAAESIDRCPERLHAGKSGSAIGAGGEIGKPRDALGKCRQHRVAVADGLVAGQLEAAENIASRANEAFLDGRVQAGSVRGNRLSRVYRTGVGKLERWRAGL